MASPTRLDPPQHQKHADRRAAERQRDDRGERAANESNSRTARSARRKSSQSAARDGTSSATAGAAPSSKASHIRRAAADSPRATPPGVAPQATCSRANSSVRGKRSDDDRCRERRQHGARRACQCRTRGEDRRTFGVDGIEGLIEHDQPARPATTTATTACACNCSPDSELNACGARHLVNPDPRKRAADLFGGRPRRCR